jgi:hypothetical protein
MRPWDPGKTAFGYIAPPTTSNEPFFVFLVESIRK